MQVCWFVHMHVCTALLVFWLLLCFPYIQNLEILEIAEKWMCLYQPIPSSKFSPKAVQCCNPYVMLNMQQNMLKQCSTKLDELFVFGSGLL
jgi:hypothetical protein